MIIRIPSSHPSSHFLLQHQQMIYNRKTRFNNGPRPEESALRPRPRRRLTKMNPALSAQGRDCHGPRHITNQHPLPRGCCLSGGVGNWLSDYRYLNCIDARSVGIGACIRRPPVKGSVFSALSWNVLLCNEEKRCMGGCAPSSNIERLVILVFLSNGMRSYKTVK